MILSLAVVTGLIALYLLLSSVQPLTEGSVITAEEWQRLEDETLSLIQRRDRVFAEIRELDFESALNKVDARDFKTLKRQYEDEAMEIMDQLQTAFDAYGTRIDSDMESVIEAARQRRAGIEPIVESVKEVPSTVTDTPKTVEKAVVVTDEVNRAAASPHVGPWTCTSCETSLPADALFCDGCGQARTVACQSCGADNRFNARFCKGCGSAMEGSA